ncbi:hypothetical protein [Pseudomonas abietaniphila]|uniref:Uncharacterized protein n=1 Tax=Pseudomonas abietaniphila TaxID=89065 RepID=A0A1G8RP75_9PSED|nr:hypothetical protein [Pseudomonas abietaniphila]SDJ18771.1 hypothetical protein SAMN05216605_12310 [Pseudomonas abietaniphila]
MREDAYENRPIDDDEISIPAVAWVTLAMEGWAARWMMLGDGRVGCVACGAGQCAGDAWAPFEHIEGCNNTGDFVQQPWLFLRENLCRLPPEPVR